MPAVKAARPKDIFAPDDWARITRLSPWRGIWLVAHAWLVTLCAAGACALLWRWHFAAGLAATPFAIAIIGGRQLGLAILMHEAAHGLLHPNRRINNFFGQWLSGAATGSDLHAYRAYHLTHHRFTQQAEDPDLSLSAPFPVSKASLKRKMIRDLTGQTFFKQRSHQFAAAWTGLKAIMAGASANSGKRDTSAGRTFNLQSRSGVDAPTANIDGAKITAKTAGRFLLIQILLLTLSLVTLGWMPFLLWLTALATSFQLFLRIRNIAEHACTATGSDDPFTHARTTYAGWLARASVAPYWVNYHSEHHLFMGVPCYNLPAAHALLRKGGYHGRMTIAPDYQHVLKQVSLG
ncbi:fatty acid desaturase family protein [Sphingorhabdus arenilitoris]|uniref:Fatty acid desaturase family protein n=1 Tax=Sphingorhabdus arenilitoris TaxID=1490041 RepID=A0ABV8RJP4_9SPHN